MNEEEIRAQVIEKTSKRRVSVSLYIEQEQAIGVKIISQNERKSQSELIREGIDLVIEKYKREIEQ